MEGSACWIELFAEFEAADGGGVAGGAVAGDEGCADLGVAFGGFELAGHAGEEAFEDEFGFDADDGVVGAGHADVGLEGGAVGEDAFVGGGGCGCGCRGRR